MSDLDLFTDTIQTKTYKREKQERFEQKVLLQLMRGLEGRIGLAAELRRDAGDDFDMIWFLRNYPSFPVKLMTYKAAKTILLSTLVKWPERTAIFKELTDARENYGDTDVGIVFASDGDQLSEMVLHTKYQWQRADAAAWRIQLKGDLVIEPLDGFIAGVTENSGWILTDPD